MPLECLNIQHMRQGYGKKQSILFWVNRSELLSYLE